MKIGGLYSHNDGEAMVYHYALGRLYDEVKDVIFETKMEILPEKHANGVEPFKQALSQGFIKRNWEREVPIPLEEVGPGGESTTAMDFRGFQKSPLQWSWAWC